MANEHREAKSWNPIARVTPNNSFAVRQFADCRSRR